MRDLVATIVAVALLFAALSLLTTLYAYRGRLRRRRASEQALGRRIVAEIPTADDLVLFTEDDTHFHHGDRSVDKRRIAAVRVLVNGSPMASYVSRRADSTAAARPTSFEDRPEGIARDRWDVAIESADGGLLVACGAIRERVSQELARSVFEAVKGDMQRRDG